MANYYASADITSVTPLSAVNPISGSTPHQFTIEWSYNQPEREYKKVEVFRFIGPKLTCITNSNISTYKEQFVLIGSVDIPSVINRPYSYTDNLQKYYSTRSHNLHSIHDIFDVDSDKQVLDEIYNTQRVIWYRILTYVSGGFFDTIPYVMCSHYAAPCSMVTLHATKTCVKHNMLHYEGDTIWIAKIRADLPGQSPSRTAIDINRLYGSNKDSSVHRGVGGYGGWGWVSERNQGDVFKLSLRDGRCHGFFPCGKEGQGDANGFGICVDKDTGDAICSQYRKCGTPTKTFRCHEKNNFLEVLSNPFYGLSTDLTRCYGLTVKAGQKGVYYAVSHSGTLMLNIKKPELDRTDAGLHFYPKNANPSDAELEQYARDVAYKIIKFIVNGNRIVESKIMYLSYTPIVNFIYCDGNNLCNNVSGAIEITNAVNAYRKIHCAPWNPYPKGFINGGPEFLYGICSGSDGQIFFWASNVRGLHCINDDDEVINVPSWGQTGRWENTGGAGIYVSNNYVENIPKSILTTTPDAFNFPANRGLTTDNVGVYPNNNNHYWLFGVTTVNLSDWQHLNGTTKTFNYRGSLYGGLYNKGSRTIGEPSIKLHFHNLDKKTISGVTDVWGNTRTINFSGDCVSAFGCAADSENNIYIAGSGLFKYYRMENNSEFPYGAKCRWPSVRLSNWNDDTLTNDSVIEWFLLRDDYYMDNNTLSAIRLHDGDGVLKDAISMTAKQAWLALTDDRRFRGGVEVTSDKAWCRWQTDGSTDSFLFGVAVSGTFGKHYYGIPGSGPWDFTIGKDADGIDHAMVAKRVQDIIEWDRIYGTENTNISGRLLYPKYDTSSNDTIDNFYEGIDVGNGHKFSLLSYFDQPYYRWPGWDRYNFACVYNSTKASLFKVHGVENHFGLSYMYSDFSGNILVNALESIPTKSAYGHPEPSNPTVLCSLTSYYESSNLNESKWNSFNELTASQNQVTGLSGYDDLIVKYVGDIQSGTYIVTSFEFFTDDYEYDYGNTTQNVSSILYIINTDYRVNFDYIDTVISEEHVYNDPTKYGLSARPPWINKDDGVFTPYCNVSANNNLYDCTPVYATSNRCNISVLERHPTPKFEIKHFEDFDSRKNWFGCPLTWKPDERFQKYTQLGNFGDIKTVNYLAFGVDPLSADIVDSSISRTFPITAWKINIKNYDTWYGLDQDVIVYDSEYTGTKSADFIANSVTVLTGDLFRYGLYKITMNVEASCTSTMNPSAGDVGNETYVQYLCVKEFEPFANFWIVSGKTVPSNYSDDKFIPPAEPTVEILAPFEVPFHFISGYAPNLTVMFQDTSEAHTFPIVNYNWNFGDYYTGFMNLTTISATNVGGAGIIDIHNTPCWTTDKVNHKVVHTYVMPGFYDVTLMVEASNTFTPDTCSRYVEVDKFAVYVEEILPQCNIKAATGDAPWDWGTDVFSKEGDLTVWFSASDSIPGSFPICRVDWDFDDGSPILTIKRKPQTEYYNNGTEVVKVSDVDPDEVSHFNTTYFDPLKIPVKHTYRTTLEDDVLTFNPSVSVYACNTNSVGKGCELLVGPVIPPQPVIADNKVDTRHLIKSRFINNNDDLLLVFEGDVAETNTIYNVAMSACSSTYVRENADLPKATPPKIYPTDTYAFPDGTGTVIISHTNIDPSLVIKYNISVEFGFNEVYRATYTGPITINGVPAGFTEITAWVEGSPYLQNSDEVYIHYKHTAFV